MKKPWLDEEGGLALQGYLGAYGFPTDRLETTFELIHEAARVYDVQPTETALEMAMRIKAIPKKRRRELAYRHIPQGKRKRVGEIDGQTDAFEAVNEWRRRRSLDVDHEALLHKVVMAVINAGHGNILKEIDDLNVYYGCKIPTVADIVGGRPETAVISGGITWDDKVYSFQVARLIRPKSSRGMYRAIGAMDSLARSTEEIEVAPINIDEMPQETVDAIRNS